MINKVLFSVLVVFIFIILCNPLSAQTLMGDVNDDGAITINDAIVLTQFIIGFDPAINTAAADVDTNGAVKMLDVLYIAQYADGIIPVIPTIAPTPIYTMDPSATPTVPPTAAPTCSEYTDVTVFGYVTKSGNPLQGANIILENKDIIHSDVNGYYSFTVPGTSTPTTITFTVEYINQWPVTRTVEIPGCGSVQATGVVYNRLELTGEIPGDIWFEQYERSVVRSKSFTTPILINSGDQPISAYLFSILYDQTKIGSVSAAAEEGFITAYNSNTAGEIILAGFDVLGKGPGTAMRFANVTWTAYNTGLSMMALDASELIDVTATSIYSRGYASWVKVADYGDVNIDGNVDIVDALLVARNYIGMPQPVFFADAADVNASGYADIVDALLIAQRYVGIITKFPAEP
jgi:hypothetical protein